MDCVWDFVLKGWFIMGKIFYVEIDASKGNQCDVEISHGYTYPCMGGIPIRVYEGKATQIKLPDLNEKFLDFVVEEVKDIWGDTDFFDIEARQVKLEEISEMIHNLPEEWFSSEE